MVTDEKIYNTALMRYRLGMILIWLGVLTWLPFIVLRIAGETPSLFWFLPFHLLGVIGGSRLRSAARTEMEMPPAQPSRLRSLGHILIFAGILVWTPYLYLKIIAQQPVDVMNYLPFHLTGVLGGITLLVVSYLLHRK
jgi:polyferredoxin